MKKVLFFSMVLFYGAAYAAQSPASNEVCKAEREKFCKDIKPGEGRILACLKEHKKDLSKECSQRVEKGGLTYGKAIKSGAREGKSKRADFAFYRKGFKDGFKSCSYGSGGKANKFSAKNERSGVCREDAAKLCANIKPGEGRVKKCLTENLAKLSEGCKAKMEKFAKAN